MMNFHKLFLVFCLVGLIRNVDAQTLTEDLSREDAQKLADDARKKGNIIRGAILFHQGNINCAKCHQTQSGNRPVGPDLRKLDEKVTEKHLIESILKPSIQIAKGYDAYLVSTVDGKTFSGVILDRNETRLVISVVDEQRIRSVEIATEDIEAIKKNPKSAMPENLANELKDRQQFLDLLRYVQNLRQQKVNETIPSGSIQPKQLEERHIGLALIRKLNCQACHSVDLPELPFGNKSAPDLSWSTRWLNPAHLQHQIQNPHQSKPGSTMPQLFSDLKESESTAKAITHFLVGKYGNRYQASTLDPSAAKRGFEVFHSTGCVACHSPRKANGEETPLADSVPLGNIASKYSLAGLIEFLDDPLKIRSSGHMPNMRLNRDEQTDVANFLLQSPSRATAIPRFEADPELADKGRQLFQQHRCSDCHTSVLDRPPTSVKIPMDKPFDRGCLSKDNFKKAPNYHLSESDRNAIQTALILPPKGLAAEEMIQISLHQFRCVKCHERNGFGGVDDVRNPHFQTTNLNLGDQGRIPPALSNVGAKIKTGWLRDVLVNSKTIRPYMKTRMPQFGEANVGKLVELFADADQLPAVEHAKFRDRKEMRTEGLHLVGNQGLNCIACHTYRFQLSDTMPAVDLTEMSDRLHKNWFYQYMLEPQRFSPNTVMPSFWPNGKAIRPDLKGDAKRQVEAIWQYLLDGRQARAPRGVVREPLEIVVTNEARMLRRSFPGVGKRGIGVGYPGGVNLVFDAEQMRLAMIWNGKFLDPSGVWRSQGHGTARPLSRPLPFPKGPDVDHATSEWKVDEGRPPNHRFKGYTLDAKQRPTFLYQIADCQVEDFFSEEKVDGGPTRLKRIVRVVAKEKSPKAPLRIRLLAGESIRKLDNGYFVLSNQPRLQVKSRSARIFQPEGKPMELRIEVPIDRTQHRFEIEYRIQ